MTASVRWTCFTLCFATLLLGCGSPMPKPACNATTCASGCCDVSGVCQSGTTSLACGTGGLQCSMCTFGVCQSGRCESFAQGGGGGGAAGGSFSSAGGSSAGGSTAGGSTAGGSTAGGSSAGGSTAGGSTAGGSTAGGSTAGGSTAGGSTAGGSTAGGSTAGGSTAGGSTAGGSTAGGSAACSPACPAGFTCNAGSCSGGSLTGVALNVSTAPLTINLLANGSALPSTCGTTNTVGRVDVLNANGSNIGTPYFQDCTPFIENTSRAEEGATLSTRLAGSALFPNYGFVSGPDILVSGPTTRTIDVMLVPVTGRVLTSGQPVSCTGTGWLGELTLLNTGVRINVPVTCIQGVVGFTARLPIRSYRAYFTGGGPHPSLPDIVPALVSNNLQVASPTARIDVNTTAAPVTFTLRQNGAPVACPSTGGSLSYGLTTEEIVATAPNVSCVPGVGYRVTHRVMPGTWEFSLINTNRALLPIVYDARFPVTVRPTDTSVFVDLTTVEVNGTITVNGAPLTNCSSSDFVFALASDEITQFDLPISCGATTTFHGRLPVGTYQFFIESHANEWPTSITWMQTMQAAPTMNFALTKRTVNFSVLANGMQPQTMCTGVNSKVGFIILAAPQGGSNGSVFIDCASPGFSKSAVVFEGQSTVDVHSTAATLPYTDTGHVLDSRTTSTFVADIPVRRLTGTVNVNGSAAGCGSSSSGTLIARGPSTVRVDLQCVQGVWTFDLWGRPGTWDLRVFGRGGGLPDLGEAPVGRLVVP